LPTSLIPPLLRQLAHISDVLQNKTKQNKMNPSNSCHVASCELQIIAIIRKKISNNFALSTATSTPCQIKYSKD
jgi:hypothetical protein